MHSKCKKIYKLDWLTVIFSDVTLSCLNFADTFWNWRVQISNVIYWNIGPFFGNFVIKLIPRIYCYRNFLQLNFHFQPYIFNDSNLDFGQAIPWLWFCFHRWMFLLGELYEQEHCHLENNNYHLGSAWQWLATNNCSKFQCILMHLLFHQLQSKHRHHCM